MLADSVQNNSGGRLSKGITDDSSVIALLEFIELNFIEFAKKVKGEISTSEKALTDKLCKFLNRRADNFPFYFQHENVENYYSGQSPQTDIGTLSRNDQLTVGDRSYGEFDTFFSMEAKRLPTPGQNREKEYVIGYTKPSGGIERFKKGIHGKGLKYAAIVGYIQEDDFNYWFVQINEWIANLITTLPNFWKTEDKLILVSKQMYNLSKFTSKNFRKLDTEPDDYIHLFHFWINLIE